MTPLAEALVASSGVVGRVAAGRSLGVQLEQASQGADAALKAALIDLCHGTLRRYGRVQAIVRLLSRRAQAPDKTVQSLLWCALYALDSGRYADYTVVDQAARACDLTHHARAKPFVNAVLRTFLRTRPALEAQLEVDAQARYWHPGWWIEKLKAAYPSDWERVAAAGNGHPPMTVRVNARRGAVVNYLARLTLAGLHARPVGSHGLLLDKPIPVASLPGFSGGEVSVQDAGAQCVAGFMDLTPGLRVLDACSAPGGKTAHLLESSPVSVLALEIDAGRAEDVRHNLRRLNLLPPAAEVEVRTADCLALDSWWDGRSFDRILADVPCSASGIVRRHPDIKWLRRASDIPAFAVRQGRILDALWRTLMPGGKLLYVTCSVFPEENGAVVEAFIDRTREARRLPLPGGAADQLLPGPEHDGFFFALLEKPL